MRFKRYIKTESFENMPVISPAVFKISMLKQLDKLKNINRAEGNSDAIEYGSIARTSDIQKHNITEIAKIIKEFCMDNNFSFYYETPEIISQNDLNRVYDDVKNITENAKPDLLTVNNTAFLQKLGQEKDSNIIPVHLGASVDLRKIEQLCDFPSTKIIGCDCSGMTLAEISELPNYINTKKYLIYGKKEIKTLPNCPLNTSDDKISGLSCSAPCTKGIYIFSQNGAEKEQLFITDGFCRIHVFENNITDIRKDTERLKSHGITNFIVDLRFFD